MYAKNDKEIKNKKGQTHAGSKLLSGYISEMAWKLPILE